MEVGYGVEEGHLCMVSYYMRSNNGPHLGVENLCHL
jgi:hypothetical protein